MSLALLNQLEEIFAMGFMPQEEYLKRKSKLLESIPDENKERCKKVFETFDKDKDGKLSLSEFNALILYLEEFFSPEELQLAVKELDKDYDNLLSFDEFLHWWKLDSNKESDTEIQERLRFIKMKLNSDVYLKQIESQVKAQKPEKSIDSTETYRLDLTVNFGVCSSPVAGLHVHYEKNEEKANSIRRKCNCPNDPVLASLSLICNPEVTPDLLVQFSALLDPLQKQLKKEGLQINSITGHLMEEDGRKYWRLAALPKPKSSPVVLGILGVIGIKQLDIDVDLSGDTLLESKVTFAVEISKTATTLLSSLKKNVSEQLTLLLSTFGNAATTLKFKGIGEGFSNTAFQDFLFKDFLEMRSTDASSVRGREALTELLGQNNPQAFVTAVLKELFIYDNEERLWPFYKGAYHVFTGLSDLVLVANDAVITVQFNFPHLKSYFASPDTIELWRSTKQNI